MQTHGPSFAMSASPNCPGSSSKTFQPSGTVKVTGVANVFDV
jgi:hypothetical protein